MLIFDITNRHVFLIATAMDAPIITEAWYSQRLPSHGYPSTVCCYCYWSFLCTSFHLRDYGECTSVFVMNIILNQASLYMNYIFFFYYSFSGMVLCATAGVRYRVEGQEKRVNSGPDFQPHITMFAHPSNLDPIVLLASSPVVHKTVGKQVCRRTHTSCVHHQ